MQIVVVASNIASFVFVVAYRWFDVGTRIVYLFQLGIVILHDCRNGQHGIGLWSTITYYTGRELCGVHALQRPHFPSLITTDL